MESDDDFNYMKDAGLVSVVETLLRRVTQDKPADVYSHISETAFAAKVEDQLNELANKWPASVGSVGEAEAEKLASLDLDVLQYTDDELVVMLEMIFDGMVGPDAGAARAELRAFLLVVRANYNADVPFHNFKHAFAVAQQCYTLLTMTGVLQKLKSMERLALFVACVGHDVCHPGLNNTYQKNAQTPLAIRYNDTSVLENYHCACVWDIMHQPACNFMPDKAARKELRSLVIPLILATDVSQHKRWVGELRNIATSARGVDWENDEHRLVVLRNFLMMADLNNETRSFKNSQRWAPKVQEEFYRQGDLERSQDLPVLPMMERSARVEKEQQGFIQYLCLPLYEVNAAVFPPLSVCVENLRSNQASWAALC